MVIMGESCPWCGKDVGPDGVMICDENYNDTGEKQCRECWEDELDSQITDEERNEN